ncbi:23S rRNA (uracil(1939)-C(5))-methyltransferase [Frankliniella fusca]|uniref:23S rRNA (Uracil(1939)-C(5))-methyltransferase n=1 Tax=Frankliniella fusca TaxID=407009 RepID=A0AAE1LE91_9NEOP|nr:23S rRNA (uracil(1939)-C(5))-methyltransferase [Frankliniella fusca]
MAKLTTARVTWCQGMPLNLPNLAPHSRFAFKQCQNTYQALLLLSNKPIGGFARKLPKMIASSLYVQGEGTTVVYVNIHIHPPFTNLPFTFHQIPFTRLSPAVVRPGWNFCGLGDPSVLRIVFLEGKTSHVSFVVISNCKEHNFLTVYVFQKRLIEFLQNQLAYKNFKSLKNLCEHQSHFGLEAERHFYATSHGKSACDGVGGTVKREARHACVQSPFQNIIGTTRELYTWCVNNLTETHFAYVYRTDIDKEKAFFEFRVNKCGTLAGTMGYHRGGLNS